MFDTPHDWIDLGYCKLPHWKVGTGPDVVLGHGWPVDSRTWRHVLPRLRVVRRDVQPEPARREVGVEGEPLHGAVVAVGHVVELARHAVPVLQHVHLAVAAALAHVPLQTTRGTC